MVPGWVIFASAIGYLLLLFCIASFGDRMHRIQGEPRNGRPIVYALSLAIYCTSWTYFGGVGLAASHGLEFAAIYIGPILIFTLGMPFLKRIIELAKAEKLEVLSAGILGEKAPEADIVVTPWPSDHRATFAKVRF